ncbi:hypothetical protein [Puniceibacterium confluentis]|uniref:hypothetical protein n=1 Tax=Puniceibacterium confluentis TaxID=1958944 RepID=UPI0016458BDC|nr:hypothetical protein [Puniceibacterium confluentis]
MLVKIIADEHGKGFAIMVADMCPITSYSAPDREQRASIAKAITSRDARIARRQPVRLF